jgi:hypothetical protein
MIEGEHSMQQKMDFSCKESVDNIAEISPIAKMRREKIK